VTAYPFPAEGLEIGALHVRDLAVADAAALAPALRDPAVGPEAGLPPFDERELAAWIRQGVPQLRASGFILPLAVLDGGEPVGGAMLTRHDPIRGQVELGYWLLRSAWGRGIATRVVRALAEHAFSTGLARVEATVRPANEASVRVLERAGFTREGVKRAGVPYAGARADAYLYSLLGGE
jgi:RimJ/RimL family protein N-acetyltransferase